MSKDSISLIMMTSSYLSLSGWIPSGIEMNFPFAPGRRAIFFDPANVDGATIGVHCTIAEIDPAGLRLHPNESYFWRVLVYFPHRQEFLEVEAQHLLTLGVPDDSPLPPRVPPNLELQVVADAEDHERITGKYRKGCWYWRDFEFAKADQPLPTWQLRSYVRGSRFDLAEVVYFVPRTDCLNRDYVVRAMRDIFTGEQS